MTPLVSVIIPTYNRAHLVGETLDSVIVQTFKNWECIVVDDGSSDHTDELLEFYCERNSRIRYYQRPLNYLKGANSCRNYGLEKSKGKYLIWFDSDDLMTPDHIEVKVQVMENADCDFVVAKTVNFKDEIFLEPYRYKKKPYGIKASDFILLKIHWYTYDVLLKRAVAEKIRWNEHMKSWQDYNYFCKMLLTTERGLYIDHVLTHRRLHLNSIQSGLTKDQLTFSQELLENRLLTYQDIHDFVDLNTEKELIFGMMNLCFEIAQYGTIPKNLAEIRTTVLTRFGRRSFILFLISILSSRVTGRGYKILALAKKR